ncbi:MAG: PilN domain-containing protein [Deltaproteobacteria bacterium]|nr:PilN domain-containing protein [Deltaproteobacteria bacterium]
MIRINLLPFRATKKTENIKRQITIFMVILGVLIVGMAWYHMNLSGKIDTLTAKVEDVKFQVAKTEKIAKKVDKIKNDLDVLNQKIAVIKNLKLKRDESVRFLDTMTKVVIPKRMWLTSLQAIGQSVNIQGIALDNKTVADFMNQLEGASYIDADEAAKKEIETAAEWEKRLQASRWFSSVNLSNIKQIAIRNNNLKNFQIVCLRKPYPIPFRTHRPLRLLVHQAQTR